MEEKMEIYLIRHGKTPGNEEKRYIGRTDETLSEQGILQLREKAYPAIDFLYASPMRRTLRTCELLYPHMEIHEIPELSEIDFGEFEGKNYRELSGDTRYQAWIDSGGTIPFPGGESRESFIARCCLGFRQMLDDLRQHVQTDGMKEENIRAAAIVHGGTIMAILSEYFGGDYFDYQVSGGEGYLVRVRGKDCRIEEVQKLSFLPSPSS